MEVAINPYILTGGVLVTLWLMNSWLANSKRKSLPLPPGPKGYPIIGSLLDMPADKPWLVYDQWFKKYNSDIIYFKVLGTSFMVLGSSNRTNDLFEKRSSNYSDRPRLPMIVELMGWDFSFAFLPYGSWWRRNRRAFHEHFNATMVSKYQPIQAREARAFLRRLLDTPENFLHHIRQTFAATVMSVAYGIRVRDANDPYVLDIEEALSGLSEAVAGRFLVDMIPLLKYVPNWFPGAEFKRRASRWRAVNDNVANKPFKAVQDNMTKGTAIPSVASALIDNLPDEDDVTRAEVEAIARNVPAVAYAGGADTTASAIQIFFLAMALHPKVQQKAQAEIDEVIGNDRIPDFSDRGSLPYINALMKETLRWQLSSPLGFPHICSEDDEYDGYFIPKGTIVMGNGWSILHDPDVFKFPEEFMPERFLKNGQLDSNVTNPDIAAFGYGRRICPGRHLSENSLYAIVSSTLAVYDIKPPVDDKGNPVELKVEFSTGLLSFPLPFKCIIKPRSATAEALIRDLPE